MLKLVLRLDRLNDESPGIILDDHELADILVLVYGPQLVESTKHLFQEGELRSEILVWLKCGRSLKVPFEEVLSELTKFYKMLEKLCP